MHYAIGALILVALAGFAAGFFLAPIPIGVLVVIAVIYTIVTYRAALSGPPGTSGGLGYIIIMPLGPVFLLFLVIGVLVGYGSCIAAVEYDWSSVGQSLSEFFLRQ